MNLRISTTTVDSFRLYTQSDWFTEDNLVSQLTQAFESNPAMNFGKAYHRLLEKGFEQDFVLLNEDNTIYSVIDTENERDVNIVLPATQFRLEHPLVTNEVKLTKQYNIQGYNITLVGQIDGLEGIIAHEHKTTPNADYEKYLNSYQWRFYCDIFGVDIVQYNIFELVGSDYAMKNSKDDSEFFNAIEGVELQSFPMHRYKNLTEDCLNLLNEFVQFIELKGLTKHFANKYLTKIN